MRFRTIRWMFLFFIIFKIFLLNCRTVSEPLNKPLIANAGPDQTTIVGSYALFDPSRSIGVHDGELVRYEWIQDENNPARVWLFGLTSDHPGVQPVGFLKEGTYRFQLILKKGEQVSEPDDIVITVKPNPFPTFEDPNLEIKVRYALKEQTGILTKEKLESLDSLHFVSIITDKVSSLSGIEKCINLKFLDMTAENISDITPLSGLYKLKYLDIDQQDGIIDNITPLSNLIHLEHLNLRCNKVTDISLLEKLTKLKFLDISFNPVEDYSVIGKLTELKKLLITRYPGKDLSIFSELINLEELWVFSGNVEDISALQNLQELVILILEDNKIEDISALKNLKKLAVVCLGVNRIVDISSLEYLPELFEVQLFDNRIEDISPLVRNPGIGKGDYLAIMANPLNEKSKNIYIPQLIKRGVFVFY